MVYIYYSIIAEPVYEIEYTQSHVKVQGKETAVAVVPQVAQRNVSIVAHIYHRSLSFA